MKAFAAGSGLKNSDFSYGLLTGNTPDYSRNPFAINDGDYITSKINSNDYDIHNEQFSEEISLIQSLWDDLGVNESYKIIFDALIRGLESSLRKEIMDFELSSLKKFSESLLVWLNYSSSIFYSLLLFSY